jgi:hypothetical protein
MSAALAGSISRLKPVKGAGCRRVSAARGRRGGGADKVTQHRPMIDGMLQARIGYS